jgi:hypothetical protein
MCDRSLVSTSSARKLSGLDKLKAKVFEICAYEKRVFICTLRSTLSGDSAPHRFTKTIDPASPVIPSLSGS